MESVSYSAASTMKKTHTHNSVNSTTVKSDVNEMSDDKNTERMLMGIERMFRGCTLMCGYIEFLS